MRYWDDMQDKFGFQDGGAIPPDAWKCRKAYVMAVNTLAAKFGSNTRAFAFDRGGMHNSCMILLCTAEQAATLKPEELCEGSSNFPWEHEASPDDLFWDAYRHACDMDVDGYVNITVQFEEADAEALLEAVAEVEVPTT